MIGSGKITLKTCILFTYSKNTSYLRLGQSSILRFMGSTKH